jgi:hypothetical protein
MLTNVGAAGIEQLLVHHRHTVLGENRPVSGGQQAGRLPFLPGLPKNETDKIIR